MTRAYIAVRTRILQAADKESGATAVEYGLMVALIAVAIIGGVTLLGGTLNTEFTTIAGDIAAA
jgi:pilus assembly protein Flp/PilA